MSRKPVAVDDYQILRRSQDFCICIAGKDLQSEWGLHLTTLESRKGGILFATSPRLSLLWSQHPHRLRGIELAPSQDLYNLARYFEIESYDNLGLETLKQILQDKLVKRTRLTHPLSEYTLGRTDQDLREKIYRKLERINDPTHWRLKLDVQYASGAKLDSLAKGLGINR
jgi:hypothetical protein